MTALITGHPISSMKSRLAAAVDLAGGQRAWCRRHGVSQADVSLALSGKKDPVPESIINALGFIVQPVCVAVRGQNQ